MRNAKLLFLILSALASSAPQTSAASETNSNIAAVAWVTMDNRSDFKNALGIIRDLFRKPYFSFSSRSVFEVPRSNYFEVDIDAPLTSAEEKSLPSFESKIAAALGKIEESDNPVLYLAIGGHGLEGILLRQNLAQISHRDLISTIFAKIDAFKKKTHKTLNLKLFYNTCHADSIRAFLQSKIAESKGDYRVDLIDASLEGALSHGNEMWEVIQMVSEITGSKGFDHAEWPLFYHLSAMNTDQVWSSYAEVPLNVPAEMNLDPYYEKLFWSANADLTIGAAALMRFQRDGVSLAKNSAFLSKVANESVDQYSRLEAIDLLQSLAATNPNEALPVLFGLLDDKSDLIRLIALGGLGKFGKVSRPYLEKALTGKYQDVQREAATLLGR